MTTEYYLLLMASACLCAIIMPIQTVRLCATIMPIQTVRSTLLSYSPPIVRANYAARITFAYTAGPGWDE